MRTIGKLFCILLILCAYSIAPVIAGTKYLEGSPQISAYISGPNEFSPGNDVWLTVVLENTGLNEFELVQSGIVDRDDLPNTAKFLTGAPLTGDAPVIIKSDPQMLGDLKGGDNRKANFLIKINSDAVSGSYMLPLTINYSYLYRAEQFGFDSIQYFYKQVNETLELPIKITSDISIDVQSVTPEHLNVGTEGYLTMKIKNTGSEDGTKAIVKILRNSNSPVVPTDSSVYIGDFLSGSTVECRYKVSVSKDAVPQVYPVSIEVVYKNREGDFITSRNDTVGVPVGKKVIFEVISNPAEIYPGNKKIIHVEYKNAGETTIYSTQARIITVDPFTSIDDIAFLGDLKPGESAIASFDVNVDRSATIKEYGLDSELRYRDALDNTYISDTMKVKLIVSSPLGISAVFSNPVYLSIIVVGIIGSAYLVLHYRKK